MRSKTFILLLIICAVLAGVSWFMLKPGPSTSRKPDDAAGSRLLADLPVNDIRRIEIDGPDGVVSLEKGPEIWIVKEKFDYPADFPKLTDLVLKLRDMKVDRTFPASADILDRLSLHASGEADAGTRGTRVALKGAEGQSLAEIIVGKPRESDAGQGGHFVMPAGGETVYVVDQTLRGLDTDAARWIDREILDVSADAVARIDRIDRIERIDRTSTDGAPPAFTVARPEKGKPAELLDVPEGRKVLPAKVNRLMDALASLRVDDVVPPDTPAEKTGLDPGRCLSYTLYDGTVYTLCLGSTVADAPDLTYLKASVHFTPPAADADAAPAEEAADADATEPTKNPAEAAAEANRRLSPWIFAIPQWKADQLITEKAALLEEPADEAAGETSGG